VSPAGAVPARFLDLQCASRENIGEAIRSRGAAVPRFGSRTAPAVRPAQPIIGRSRSIGRISIMKF